MDRNLGASQVATAHDDVDAYGDLFQWGRAADGHQVIEWTSSTDGNLTDTTETLAGTDTPGHGDFILAPDSPWDWRDPKNDNMWEEDGTGINNPCPDGWRVPTEDELDNERASWGTQDRAGAFGSDLKWTAAGYRSWSSGSLEVVGSSGLCWSSSVSGFGAGSLDFGSSNASMGSNLRAGGFSVRCLRD